MRIRDEWEVYDGMSKAKHTLHLVRALPAATRSPAYRFSIYIRFQVGLMIN